MSSTVREYFIKQPNGPDLHVTIEDGKEATFAAGPIRTHAAAMRIANDYIRGFTGKVVLTFDPQERIDANHLIAVAAECCKNVAAVICRFIPPNFDGPTGEFVAYTQYRCKEAGATVEGRALLLSQPKTSYLTVQTIAYGAAERALALCVSMSKVDFSHAIHAKHADHGRLREAVAEAREIARLVVSGPAAPVEFYCERCGTRYEPDSLNDEATCPHDGTELLWREKPVTKGGKVLLDAWCGCPPVYVTPELAKEIETMREQKSQAVDDHEYEKAATIRDTIIRLRRDAEARNADQH